MITVFPSWGSSLICSGQGEAVHPRHVRRRSAPGGTAGPLAVLAAGVAALLRLPARRWAAASSCPAFPRGSGDWWRCRRRPAPCAAENGGLRRARPGDGSPARRPASGCSKWNVLPRPTWLSTQIRPPIRSHQPRRDGQPQAGPAVAAGNRAVGLLEGLEDGGLLLGRDADPRVGTLKCSTTSSSASDSCSTSTHRPRRLR